MRDLETDRLLIRAFRPEDLDGFADLMDRAFGASASGEMHGELLAYYALGEAVHDRLKQPPYGDRAVVLKEGGALVGSVGFVPSLAPFGQLPSLGGVEDARHTPEVGLFWAVSPEHRGKGYATEAAGSMVRFGFGELRLGRLVATTDFANEASIGVMRRLGMRVERNPIPAPAWFQVVGVLECPS